MHTRHIPLSETIEAWIFVIGVLFAVWLVQSDVVASVIGFFGQYQAFAAFATGIFYTSILTTAPAVVAFAELSAFVPAWKIALFGSIGAVGAEVLMFRFIRSPFVEHVMRAAFHPTARLVGRRVASGSFWWIAPLSGAIVIGSPLPDELGLLMLGLSHIRLVQFIPLAFAGNVVGIFAIAAIASYVG